MLCLSGEGFLVWEPFNYLVPIPRLMPKNPLQRHYQRLLPEEEQAMRRFIRWKIPLDFVLMTEGGGDLRGRLSRLRTITRNTGAILEGRIAPIFKDPIALMSAEWFAREYQARVIISVRHPAAYVNSVLRLDWRTPVEDILHQDHLMAALPEKLADEVRARGAGRPMPEHYDIEDAALCWKVFHSMIDRYRKDHPDWLIVRHEDLSTNYTEGFRLLYAALGLRWDNEVENMLSTYCSSSNTVTQGRVIHEFRQNSAALAGIWHGSFTQDELETIRRITSPVWELFYEADSWTSSGSH